MSPPKKITGRALLAGAVAIAAPAGCFALGEGLEPPARSFYYPTALATSPGQHTLYVVNSDFDIQYTGGTVQALDLDALRQCLGRLAKDLAGGASAQTACLDIRQDLSASQVDEALNPDPALVPGPCAPILVDADLACSLTDDADTEAVEGDVKGPIIRQSRIIGAFASSAALAQRPSDVEGDIDARLFVAVRGDPSVTVFDTAQDSAGSSADPTLLDCHEEGGEDGVGSSCTSRSRVGVYPNESKRYLTLPIEPVGIAAAEDGSVLVAVHETEASASLIINDWNDKPTLEYVLGGLPDSPSDVAAIPKPRFVTAAGVEYLPRFLVTYRAATAVDLLRFYDDSAGTSRHFLQRVDSFTIATNSDGSDSRGIAILDANRRACEDACADDDVECLRACLDVPLDVFIANRAPASLLLGKLTTTLSETETGGVGVVEQLHVNDMVPLTAGPSRVAIGDVLDADGQPSPRVFVVSFDSRYVAIYDPAQRRIEAAIHTGRGPHALAFDVHPKTDASEGTALLFVAHFTDSYLGVVDLDTRHATTYGSMLAAVGPQTPPKDN